MAKKGPKTLRGQIRKAMTGDGRKNLDTAVREELWGKKPKGKKKGSKKKGGGFGLH